MAKELEWTEKLGTFSRPYWVAGDHIIEMNVYGEFVVKERTVPFGKLAEAKACCQQQEDATPADLPTPGDVWGVPGKPETRRLIRGFLKEGQVVFSCVVNPQGCLNRREWQSWVASSGAVRIGDGDEDEAARLRMKAAEDGLRQANQRIEEMRDSVAVVAKERDGLRERVKELEGERDVCRHPSTYYSVEHDNYYCSKCKAGMGEAYYRERHATQTETERERDELRHKFDALKRFKDWTHARLDSLGVPHHPPGVHGAAGCRIGDRMDWLEKERDELRAAVERTKAENLSLANQLNRAEAAYTRLMAALRGIEGFAYVCLGDDAKRLTKMAREAREKEEGGAK